MVIQPRSGVSRDRVLYLLSLILSITVLIGVVREYFRVSGFLQALCLILGTASAAAIVLVFIQLYSFPRRSHALVIQREGDMIIATNVVHESYKFRFLRDVLSEHVIAFSDDDRTRFKSLESDGYYPSMLVRGVRKLLLLRLCTMMFDDVYFVDSADRWEHHDSSSTSEPSFHKREMPPLRTWKGIGNLSS
jgi:hypothetical protein